MTIYNVHIYREMKLLFDGIEADSPEAAANIARDELTEDADDIDDCDGKTLAALIDVVGDDQFKQSTLIDFDSEATTLREALACLATAAEDLNVAIGGVTDQFDAERTELQVACSNARKLLIRGQVHDVFSWPC